MNDNNSGEAITITYDSDDLACPLIQAGKSDIAPGLSTGGRKRREGEDSLPGLI